MATTVRYKVRALTKDGRVVFKDEYKRESVAVNAVERLVDKGRAVHIRRVVTEDDFRIEPSSKWGIRSHSPYSYGIAPLRTIYIHTSVTTQLGALAPRLAERAQMRSVDNIAFGRGFNGFSYSFGVFPSGRAYEGRGLLVAEAATEPYNTSSDSVCCIGNTDAFNPTKAQIEGIIAVIKKGQRRGAYAHTLDVWGHRKVAAKACPGILFTDANIAYIQHQVNR